VNERIVTVASTADIVLATTRRAAGILPVRRAAAPPTRIAR